jgi:AraC-like DNA-binding protein
MPDHTHPDRVLSCSGPYGVFIHHGDDAPRRRDWAIPRRRQEFWLLVTSLEGAERIRVDGRSHDIPVGGSYLIQPGRLHDLGSQCGNVPVWLHFDLLFDPRRGEPRHFGGPYDSDLGSRAVHLQPDAERLWGVDLPVPVPAPLDAVFRDEVPAIVRGLRAGLPGRMLAEARLAVLIARLVGLVWERSSGARVEDDLDRLTRAEAVARHRLDTGFGLESFAAAAGLGRSRFCQLYARLRGEPPGAFLRRERQARAESLLRGTELPLAQIANLVGFRDATVFVRAFRRERGLTPGAWRAAARR